MTAQPGTERREASVTISPIVAGRDCSDSSSGSPSRRRTMPAIVAATIASTALTLRHAASPDHPTAEPPPVLGADLAREPRWGNPGERARHAGGDHAGEESGRRGRDR